MIRREIGDDGICILTFDRPESGANIFDAATMQSLREQLDAIEKDASIKGVIVTSAKKSIFIAGADLKTLLKQAQSGEMRGFISEGQKVFNRLVALKVPTVAAIHGACAGGGYEITLACDYRVASDDPATKIGLPETTLGLVPAWGGATRLPRLIGANAAAEVILKGKLYGAAEALKLGLVDEVVPKEQILEAARRKLAAGKRKLEGGAPATPASQELSPPKKSGNAAPGRAYEIIKRSGESTIEEEIPNQVSGRFGRDQRAGRDRSDPKPDSEFLPRGQVSQRLIENSARENPARGGDWRRCHGLGDRAMAERAWRFGYPARRRFGGD